MDANKQNLAKDFGAKQKDYFDRNYGVETKVNYLRRRRNKLINGWLASSNKPRRVLDVGCGPAILYEQLAEDCGDYYAFDMVQTNLDEIEENNRQNNVITVLGDLDTQEWDAGFFDLIICSGSLEYTDDPGGNLTKLLAWLADDGTLIFSMPNIMSPFGLWRRFVYNPIWLFKGKLVGKPRFLYPRRAMSRGAIVNLIVATGGSYRYEIKYLGLKLILQPFDRIFSGLDCRIERWSEKNPSSNLNRLSLEILAKVTKVSNG